MDLKKRFSIVYLTRDDWTEQQQLQLESALDIMCEGMGLTFETFYNYSEPEALGLVTPSGPTGAMTRQIPKDVMEILIELAFDSHEATVSATDLAHVLIFLDCSGAVQIEQVIFGSDDEVDEESDDDVSDGDDEDEMDDDEDELNEEARTVVDDNKTPS